MRLIVLRFHGAALAGKALQGKAEHRQQSNHGPATGTDAKKSVRLL